MSIQIYLKSKDFLHITSISTPFNPSVSFSNIHQDLKQFHVMLSTNAIQQCGIGVGGANRMKVECVTLGQFV